MDWIVWIPIGIGFIVASYWGYLEWIKYKASEALRKLSIKIEECEDVSELADLHIKLRMIILRYRLNEEDHTVSFIDGRINKKINSYLT